MKKHLFIFLLYFVYAVSVDAATGYIDTTATNTAKVCYDTTCTSPAPSTINFELSQQSSIVVDSVTGISGYVWGDALGWINLNPTGQGVVFANTSTGLLTGKAWSQVSGWITVAVTGQQVTINPSTGEFAGWAWSGGPYGGWIKFNCGDSASCVKTTWRNSASSGGGGGGGAVVLPQIDVCPNIQDLQVSIPSGYTVNALGQCTVVVDVCPNFAGEQSDLPVGYVFDSIGACVPTRIDYCPNIKGAQYTLPQGYEVFETGECKKILIDLCPLDRGVQLSYTDCFTVENDSCSNLIGIQETIPVGYSSSQGMCYPEAFDMCTNIEGSQLAIPTGYVLSEDGSCTIKPDDLCDNLGGSQVIVPKGFIQEGTHCFFAQTVVTPPTPHVVAFSFVPKKAQIASSNAIVKTVVQTLQPRLINETQEYQVDLISFYGALVAGIGACIGVFSILRRFL